MTQRRDTIVIGTSAGGAAALRALLGQLDDDLPAAVAVVQHLSCYRSAPSAWRRATSRSEPAAHRGSLEARSVMATMV